MGKKTILIAHNFIETSFSVMSHDLACFLADLGYRIIFISYKPYFENEKVIKRNKGKIIVMSWKTTKRPVGLGDFMHFYRIYLKYKPEIVIGHFAASNISAIVSKICSFGKVKTFIYYHSVFLKDTNRSRNELILKNLLDYRKRIFYKLFCDKIICPSHLSAQDLKARFNYTRSIVVLNPMRDRGVIDKLDFKNTIVISFLGGLIVPKGIIELMEAFNYYKLKYPKTSIILNIAGNGTENKKVRELGKDNKSVFLKGRIEYKEVDDFVGNSHFLIIPSKMDNLPTVGLESLMKGTPLLLSTKTGLADYLNEEFDCFKFIPNKEDIVRVFEKVEHSHFDYNSMRRNARKTYLRLFGMEDYCNNILKLIS